MPIDEAELDEFFDFKASSLVPFVLRLRPTLLDPDDERILEVAVECRTAIVAHKKRFRWAVLL